MARFGRTTPSRQVLRSFRVALSIALGLELLYLVVANAVLGFGWLERRLSSDPDDLTVSFERPWTLLPGRVHLRRFELRFEDDNVVLALALDRAAMDVDLAALLSRRLHLTQLDGEGLSVRLATKGDEPAKTELYPPILAARPRPQEPPDEAVPDDRHWTVDLRGIDTTLEELWIREHRYTGSGRTRGGFRFVPKQSLQVHPSEVELHGGELRYGAKEKIARALVGRARAELHEHPLSAHEGWRLFSYLDLQGKLEAEVVSLRSSRGYWKDAALDQGEGSFVTRLSIERGVIRPPSYAEYRTRELRVTQPRFALRGDALVRVTSDREGGTLSMSADRLELLTSGQPAVVASKPRLTMKTATTDIARPWPLASAGFALPDVRAADLARLAPLSSRGGLRPSGGSARARARAETDAAGKLTGEVAVRLHDAELVLGKAVKVHATGRIDAAFAQPRADRATGHATKLALLFDHVRFQTAHGSTRGGWLRVDTRTLRYRDGKPTELDAALRAGFPNAEPVLAALGIRPTGLGRVATALLDLEDLNVVGRIRYSPAATSVDVTRANTDSVTARGRWQRRQGKERGAFLLETRLIDAGLMIRDGETQIEWRVDEPWLGAAFEELRLGESGS